MIEKNVDMDLQIMSTTVLIEYFCSCDNMICLFGGWVIKVCSSMSTSR